MTQVQKTLRDCEHQLAEVQALAHLGSWEWDVKTDLIFWSDELYRIFGLTRAEVPRITLEFLLGRVHPEDVEAVQAQIQAALDRNSFFSHEYRILRSDGEIRTISGRGRMYLASDGSRIRMMGTGQDVTERKRIEEELVRAKVDLERVVAQRTAELERMIQARDEFLSIASHELKTPLTTLRLQTQIRQRDLDLQDLNKFTPDRLARMFNADERQIVRLGRVIDDMLDVSRIHTGKLKMEMEEFDLSELVNDVIDRLALHRVDVQFEGDSGVMGVWDRQRIEQVLTNLITNAAKYGGGSTITVRLKKCDEGIELRVEDRGVGIPKEDHERIFDRFERAVSANEVSGLGLGLYIVRQIVEAHRGTVRVESELGRGSDFIVWLPTWTLSSAARSRALL